MLDFWGLAGKLECPVLVLGFGKPHARILHLLMWADLNVWISPQ